MTHIDSFSGALADLPRCKRDRINALRVLARRPRVSVFDLNTAWLAALITDLMDSGLIRSSPEEPYPWCYYVLTADGKALIAEPKT